MTMPRRERSFYFTRSSDDDSCAAWCVGEGADSSTPAARETVIEPSTSRFSARTEVEITFAGLDANSRRCGNASQISQTFGSASRSSSAISRGNRNLKWRHDLTHSIYRHFTCQLDGDFATKRKLQRHGREMPQIKKRGRSLAFEI